MDEKEKNVIFKILKAIYQRFNIDAVRNASHERMPLDKQKEYLKQFDEPINDYERSFFKYKCYREHCYYGRKWLILTYNLGALFIHPFLFRKLSNKGKSIKRTENSVDAVIENVDRLPNDDVIPDDIVNKYKVVKIIKEINYKDSYLNENAVAICKNLNEKYFWNFYFRVIVMLKLAQFSSYIEENNPKAIIFYSCEREFSGPLQTHLCELENVRYESFMHGDYLFQLCFAFQRYSLYYTWDNSYNKMFDLLRCNMPMIVYTPKKHKGVGKLLDERECKYFATYYFSNETRESAEKVYAFLKQFSNNGLRCKIRPHPRFSDVGMLNEVFFDIEIENLKEYSLEDSIRDSLYIIGLNTTVLSQAFFSGKQVIIDDVSMKEKYNELKDKMYIMINRPHLRFSELIDSIDNNEFYDQTYKFYSMEKPV